MTPSSSSIQSDHGMFGNTFDITPCLTKLKVSCGKLVMGFSPLEKISTLPFHRLAPNALFIMLIVRPLFIHNLFSCPILKQVWDQLHPSNSSWKKNHNTFFEWFKDFVFQKCPFKQEAIEGLMKLSFTCWFIWCHRNKVVFNNIYFHMHDIVNTF